MMIVKWLRDYVDWYHVDLEFLARSGGCTCQFTWNDYFQYNTITKNKNKSQWIGIPFRMFFA